jgi:hypothetical protein
MNRAPDAGRRHGRGAPRGLLALALVLGVIVGSRALTDEGAFFLGGDPPRYLMNGMFLYDLLRAAPGWHPADVLTFAERYYARYPALSLGHHMPLLPLMLVPFYAVLGVSVFSARLAMLTFFVLAIVLLYRLVARRYDGIVAGWACVLFATSPIIGSFSQRVLSEMPTIVMMLVALNLVERFRTSGRLRDYLLLIAAATASLLCRPTAVYMFPAYGILLIAQGGHSRFKQRGIAVATLVGLALVGGAIAAIVTFAPFNAAAAGRVLMGGVDLPAVSGMLRTITRERPLFAAIILAAAAAMITRDRRMVPVLIWIGSVLVCAVLLTGSIEPGRYSILAVPAYCIVAASLAASIRPWRRLAASIVLVVVTGLQLVTGFGRPVLNTPGYEAAAQYVVGLHTSPAVLYSASIDTGYFVFFVRKHDLRQRLVVLRSDKLLTTSLMTQLSVEDRIHQPAEVYSILRRYGVRLIVIEDRPSGSVPLEWLRAALLTDRFVERTRIPIGDGEAALRGVSIVVYEYLDATAAEPGATLDLDLPLAGRSIRVAWSDLAPLDPKD